MRKDIQMFQKKKEKLLEKKQKLDQDLAQVLQNEQDLIYEEVIVVFEKSNLSLEEFTKKVLFEKELSHETIK
ncbi:TPA: hypothetical protein U2C64_002128 [Streptococcus suis]|nr:hypothetical protein [Streptococcus suis]HEM6256146.1 hypothetical protein [Streptococcus suis]HEM6449704.1 hypothetical protein [Streptococcus suis]